MAEDDNSMNNARTMRPGSGETLGRIDQYELLRELGGGGFGTVYLAKDTVSGIKVAVKGLPPFVKNNREEMENIRANFALVSRLTHTNIAKVLVLHPAKDVAYVSGDARKKLRVDSGDTLMVMEYAPGVTLSQWRKQFPDRKVPIGQALAITRQIASALDYAHERKIVHRDIKPANVMVETAEDGSVTARVLDFGLAAEIRSSMGRVSREIHDTSGTRPYMAPEQWLGGKQGPATDQYALAALFCELVTGEVPFAAVFDTGDPVVMMNVAGREPFAPPQDLPKPVRLALARALAKKPEERFANCGEFVAALEGLSSRERSRLSRPPGGPSPVAALKALLAVAALAALAAGGYFGWVKYDESVKARTDEEAHVAEEKGKAGTTNVTAMAKEDYEKFIIERKRQQDEAEKEIDIILSQGHGETKKWAEEKLIEVWRKQINSLYEFGLSSEASKAYKKIRPVVRQRQEAEIRARKNGISLPKFSFENLSVDEQEAFLTLVKKCRREWKSVEASFTLAALGCKKALAFMFEHGISDPNYVFDGGYLHYAASYGRTDMIDFLLERGADINLPDQDGQTPVSWALHGENALITVKYLVDRGAAVTNVVREESLLQDAVSHKALDVVKYIIEDLGYRPDDGECSELMGDKSRFMPKEIKDYLQSHGIKDVLKRTTSDETPMEKESGGFTMSHKGIQLWEGGPYWAETNIGAEKSCESGYYFWWGDTVGYKREKSAWVANNGLDSRFSFEKKNTPTLTNDQSMLRHEGWIAAGKNCLSPEHDAARVSWGGDWRMPTMQELSDLCEKCDWTWTKVNDVNGYVVHGRKDYASAYIFLPCAGYGNGNSLDYLGSCGLYWSSVPYTSSSDNSSWSWYLCIGSDFHATRYFPGRRYYGGSVRPVKGHIK